MPFVNGRENTLKFGGAMIRRTPSAKISNNANHSNLHDNMHGATPLRDCNKEHDNIGACAVIDEIIEVIVAKA